MSKSPSIVPHASASAPGSPDERAEAMWATKFCEHCRNPIKDAQRSTARFCSERCKKAFQRAKANVPAVERPSVEPATQPAPQAVSVPKKAIPAEAAQVIRKLPTVSVEIKVRIWPAEMKMEEVKERLYRMRDYNATMRRQGTPQHCSTEAYVIQRLDEAGADHKLVKIVFP